MSTDRRHPVIPFDASLIQDYLLGRDVSTVALFPSGKSNSNYKLTLSTGEICVLRLYNQNEDAAQGTTITNLVTDLLPVPHALHHGDGWSVFTYLEGELLATVPEHTEAAAEALAKLSTITFPSPGFINADGTVSPFPFATKGFIETALEDVIVQKWIGEESAESMSQILRREAGRYAELWGDSRLVHGDFNPTNILIQAGAVSGVLDWEFSHAGTPYMDIGNLLRHTHPLYHPSIKAGLEAGGMTLPDDWQERAELVDISSQFEFLTSGKSDAFKGQCVARINGFIRNHM